MKTARVRHALPAVALLGLTACIPAQEPPIVFVSLPAADSVIRLDAQTGRVLARTRVGRLPHHLAVDEVSRRVYVTLTGSQAVAELDADTGALLRTLLTEPVPERRADGTRIQGHFERDAFSHTSCYDCHRGGPDGVKPVIVGARPFGLALAEDRRSLFVTNTRGGSLVRIDLATGHVVDRMAEPGGESREPTGLARLGERLFYTALAPQPSTVPAKVRAIATNGLHTQWETTGGARPNTLAADPHRARLYAANFETNTVSAYGLDGRLQAAFTVGAGPQGLRPLPDGEHLLVADYYANTLSLVDLATGKSEAFALDFGGRRYSNPTHIALLPDGREALVVASGSDGHLLRVDLQRRAVVAATALGPLPFDVAAVGAPGSVSSTTPRGKQP